MRACLAVMIGWAGAHVVLFYLAGVPAGLAVIWRHRRKVLMRYFWVALLAGVVCELIALGTFISGALSVP